MAYYDEKIGKYCMTKEEMETLPKDEAKAKLGKGILKNAALIAGGVALPVACALTGVASSFVVGLGATVVAAHLGLTGLTGSLVEIRDYFRNNKRLEYDENNEKNR